MDAATDALLAARLLRRDPAGLGGIILRGAGPARDAVVAALGAMLRMPVGIDDEALIGGRDLAATLAGESEVARKGLLARADGGLLLVAMAERMSDSVAARIAAAMDMGEVLIERDGATARHPARFALVLLDDGQGDERVPDRLAERCAFRFDLDNVASAMPGALIGDSPPLIGDSPQLAERVDETSNLSKANWGLSPISRDDQLKAMASATAALGIDSVRAPLMALRVAALIGGGADALATAARLVLGHRATRLPAPEDASDPVPEPETQGQSQVADTLDDIVLDAVTAALPADLLARMAAGQGRKSSKGGGAGERRRSPTRGRPLGARAGLPRGGARLALIDTLRAAAPWQRLRGASGRIAIRREDIRIKRFETRAEATTIFAVDASGSAAAQRLGEAKGAVELLLAEAYVKRTEVALIAFRGSIAEVLLPPTRSLTRARRELAELPGGGGTPLASGIEMARLLAESVRAKGRTPFVVVLSDGRANVATQGSGCEPQADALRAARAFATSNIASAFIDISARPRAEASALAAAMAARYIALPRADAMRLHTAIMDAM